MCLLCLRCLVDLLYLMCPLTLVCLLISLYLRSNCDHCIRCVRYIYVCSCCIYYRHTYTLCLLHVPGAYMCLLLCLDLLYLCVQCVRCGVHYAHSLAIIHSPGYIVSDKRQCMHEQLLQVASDLITSTVYVVKIMWSVITTSKCFLIQL